MRLHHKYHRLLSVALFVTGSAVAVAQAASAAEAKSTAAAAKAKESATPAGRVEVQKMIEQINSQRDKMVVEHEALAKQLKDATEAQRNLIMEKMREQKKAFEAAQSALYKQIRDEQRRLRQGSSKR
jgi:hypothetical protein